MKPLQAFAHLKSGFLRASQVKFFLKLVFTTTLVGLIVWQLGGLAEVGSLIARIHPQYIPVILIVITLDRALMTYKWVWLLRSRDVYFPFLYGMRIYCASMMWGLLLPVTVGADAIRAFSASRLGFNTNEIITSIIIERMIGFLSALLLGLMSLMLLSLLGSLDARFRPVWWLGSAMVAGIMVIFAASFSQSAFDLLHDRLLQRFRDIRLVRQLRQLHATYQAYQHNKRILAVFFGLTFCEQLLPILQFWLIAQGMGIEGGILYIAGAVPLAFLIARLPISISGVGVLDGAFILLMSFAGVTAAEAVAIVLVDRILEAVAWSPWWGAHVIGRGSIRPPQPSL